MEFSITKVKLSVGFNLKMLMYSMRIESIRKPKVINFRAGDTSKLLIERDRFSQACRGGNYDSGIKVYSSGNSQTDSVATSSYKIPTLADILLAHSTVEGKPFVNLSWMSDISQFFSILSNSFSLARVAICHRHFEPLDIFSYFRISIILMF